MTQTRKKYRNLVHLDEKSITDSSQWKSKCDNVTIDWMWTLHQEQEHHCTVAKMTRNRTYNQNNTQFKTYFETLWLLILKMQKMLSPIFINIERLIVVLLTTVAFLLALVSFRGKLDLIHVCGHYPVVPQAWCRCRTPWPRWATSTSCPWCSGCTSRATWWWWPPATGPPTSTCSPSSAGSRTAPSTSPRRRREASPSVSQSRSRRQMSAKSAEKS